MILLRKFYKLDEAGGGGRSYFIKVKDGVPVPGYLILSGAVPPTGRYTEITREGVILDNSVDLSANFYVKKASGRLVEGSLIQSNVHPGGKYIRVTK